MRKLFIPVKVLLVAGVAYGWSLLAVSTLIVHFAITPKQLWLGFALKNLLMGIPLLFLIVAAVGATYYFVVRPLKSLSQMMEEAGRGDFLIRAKPGAHDEIGLLAQSFNKMLERVTDLYTRKIQTEYDLIVVREELKYKKRLEEKGQLIEKTNKTLENLVKDLSLIYEIGQGINQTVELTQLYELIANVLQRHLRLGNFSLMVWDEKMQVLQIKSAFGFEETPSILEVTFKGGEGIAGEVLKTGRPIYAGDALRERRFVAKGISMNGSLLSIPLNYKGETLGVVNFGREGNFAFSNHDIKMLTLVANQVALAMANAKLYTQTRELSVKDELTAVYNRRHFAQVLQLEWKRAVRFKRELSLLMIDVDFFKRYNDTYGHLEGDKILRELGALLAKNLREVDTVARFGGEEFVALLPDTDKRGALAVAEKLRHMVQEGLANITVSIGVANFPDDVSEMDDLIDHADIALYDAKDNGRNKVVTYTPQKPSEILQSSLEEKKEEPTNKERIVH